MEEKKSDKTYGVIGTTIFHVALLLILMILGLRSMPQEEEGILINFGDSPTGMGPAEPVRNMPVAQQTTPAPSRPTPVTPPPPARTQPAREQLMTQDVEKAPAVSAEEKARRETQQRRVEEERRRQEEVDRQRRVEQERQRQEELERQRILAEERKKQEEQQRQAQAARDAASRAFSNTAGTGQSEGTTQGAGNQGQLTGDPNAASRTGSGLGQSGSSFSLSGRSLSGALPRPEYNIQEEGIVVVEITVDRNGVVTDAQPILRGTTTQNSYLWRVAREAALKARFNSSPNSPAYQKGTITYHFILN
jgi:colicin import membrane protein